MPVLSIQEGEESRKDVSGDVLADDVDVSVSLKARDVIVLQDEVTARDTGDNADERQDE